MDELKRYINDHKSNFEQDTPADLPDLWNQIDAGISQSEEKENRLKLFSTVWKVAAMLVLLAGVGWLGLTYNNSSQVTGGIASEWQETEQFYQQQINEKMQVLEAKKDRIDEVVFSDLEMMDQAFQELKKDLKDGANNEEVVKAMIKNYRIKLEILEQILNEIEADEADLPPAA